MSLRAFVALVALALLGVPVMVGAITGNYIWTVPVVIGYVIWMFKRDSLPDRGRLSIRDHRRWQGYRR